MFGIMLGNVGDARRSQRASLRTLAAAVFSARDCRIPLILLSTQLDREDAGKFEDAIGNCRLISVDPVLLYITYTSFPFHVSSVPSTSTPAQYIV